MIDDVVDIAGTMLLIVAPIVLVLIVIVVVVAYPWVVLIPVGTWWVVAKYGEGETNGPVETNQVGIRGDDGETQIGTDHG